MASAPSTTTPQHRAVASGLNLKLEVPQGPEGFAEAKSPLVHVNPAPGEPLAFFSPPSATAVLSPKPVAIDMPSPASFDPMLEHFLRVVEPSAGTCACLLERSPGSKFRMLLENGNVPLLQAEKTWSSYSISAADGTQIAQLSRSSHGGVLTARSLPNGRSELAAFQLHECELKVPSKPKLNRMQLAMSRLPDDGTPGGVPAAKALGRAAGELAAAMGPQAAAPTARCGQCESRLPTWDERRDCLTLDFPPGRALLASVQNFQLIPAVAERGLGQKRPDAVVLVHGLLTEGDGAPDVYSLDFAHPLSPLVAFAAVLSAQAWQ